MPNVYNHGTILATAGYDSVIRFWDAATAKCCRTVTHDKSQVNRMAITRPRGQIAVAGNPEVRVYDVAGKSTSELAVLDGHRGNVTALGYEGAGQWLFTASEDASLRIWDTRDKPGTALETRTTAAVYAGAVHPAQGAVLAGDQDGKVYTWDLRVASHQASSGAGARAECLQAVRLDGGMSVRALAVSPDGRRVAVASNTGRAVVYACDSAGGRLVEVASWAAHPTYILQMAFSPDGSVLATASADHTVKLWTCAPGGVSSSAPGTAAAPSAPSVPAPVASVPGAVVSDPMAAATAGTTTATSTADGRRQHGGEEEGDKKGGFSLWRTLAGHQRWVWDCAFNSDGEYLLTGSSDHTAKLWRLSTGEVERQFVGHQKAISCIALNDSF